MDKVNNQDEEYPKEGARNRAPLAHTFRNPIKDTKLEAIIHTQRIWCCPPQAGPVPAVSISVYSCDLWFRSSRFRWLYFLVSWSVFPFSSFFSTGFPEPRGERFDGDIPFRVECSKFSTIFTISGYGSQYLFSICCKRKIPCILLSKTLIWV